MAEFQKNIGGASIPSTQISVKAPVPGGESVLVKPLTEFASSALGGYATSKLKEDVSYATGATVPPETVQKNVEAYNTTVAPSRGQVTPEEYEAMSNKFLGDIDADARTTLSLVQSGDISSLHGEAFVRKQVAAAAANPFWAALGGKIQDAAGPLGGGRNVAKGAFASSAMSELEARAEGQRKAIQAYEEEVNGLVARTKLPRSSIENFIQRKVTWEESQKAASQTVTTSLNHAIEGTHLDVTEAIYARLNPETNTLDSTAVTELEVMLGRRKNDMMAAINSSLVSDEEKAAKTNQIEKMFKGYEAEIAIQSKTSVVQRTNEQTAQVQKLLGTQLMPMHTFLVANGLQDMANSLVYVSGEQMRGEMERKFGKEGTEQILANSAAQMPILFGQEQGRLVPNPALGAALGAPDTANLVEEAFNSDPGFNAKMYKQSSRYPVETMDGVSKGPLIKAANTGNESSQQAIVTSVGATVKQLMADIEVAGMGMEFYESAKAEYGVDIPNVRPRIEMRLAKATGTRGRPSSLTIDVPDGMEDRAEQLNALYKIVKKSPWMWPEGASPLEAFNAIVNGEYDPKEGMGALTEGQQSQARLASDKAPRMEDKESRGGAGVSLDTDLPSYTQSEDGGTDFLKDVSSEELLERTKSMGTPRFQREAAQRELDKRSATPQGGGETSTGASQSLSEDTSLPDAAAPAPSELQSMEPKERFKALGINPSKAYSGESAVEIVEALEGPLSPIEKYTVMEEGFQGTDYKDEKGVSTSGVGQTGKFKDMEFREVFRIHKEKADKAIPNLKRFPEDVQAALYSSWYRGMLSDSKRTISLLNNRMYRLAAEEFLDAKDYREGSEGVKARMERVAEAIRSLSDR